MTLDAAPAHAGNRRLFFLELAKQFAAPFDGDTVSVNGGANGECFIAASELDKNHSVPDHGDVALRFRKQGLGHKQSPASGYAPVLLKESASAVLTVALRGRVNA